MYDKIHYKEKKRKKKKKKRKLELGTPAPEVLGLGNISKVLEDRGSHPHPLGALGTLVSVRKTRQKRFKRGLN